jgi:hypothetical protein
MQIFLLATLALAFYNVGTIWAHEVDIFRSWQYVGADFQRIQTVHWRKLRYWVLAPVVIAFAAGIALLWYHPQATPRWCVIAFVGLQALSIVLTIAFWGRWQAALSQDPAGANSLFLQHILRTHWIRTALVTLAALSLLCAAISVCAAS